MEIKIRKKPAQESVPMFWTLASNGPAMLLRSPERVHLIYSEKMGIFSIVLLALLMLLKAELDGNTNSMIFGSGMRFAEIGLTLVFIVSMALVKGRFSWPMLYTLANLASYTTVIGILVSLISPGWTMLIDLTGSIALTLVFWKAKNYV